jgi:outer membrane immunogenic protein
MEVAIGVFRSLCTLATGAFGVKNLLILSAASSAFIAAVTVHAADLPIKAPVAAASAPTSSWTGFYLGAELGFTSSRTDETSTSATIAGVKSLAPLVANSEPLDGIALRGGSYVGYNWQVSPRWVLGIEGNVGSVNQTTTFAGLPFPAQSFGTFSAADGIAAKTTWDASARGRLGFLVTPATLVYATGGAAWQHYEVSTTCASAFCANSFFSFGRQSLTPAVTSNSATKVGWTAGAGIETALWGNWIARADYRYADLGTSTFAITRFSTVPPLNPIANTFDVALRTHTATVGIAYKFGDPVALSNASGGWPDALPVKAIAVKAAPATASWSGLYAGLGLGLRASRSEATTTSEIFGFEGPQVLKGLATSEPVNGTAFRGSPYLGLNWQVAPRWVIGIEGDVGFADQTTTLAGLAFSPGITANGLAAADSFAVRTRWDASVRGRAGLLVTPATLAYATGGAAWQRFEVTSVCGSNMDCGGLTPLMITNSATKAGWTVGGGLETMLSGNWFARGDYRYADFGASAFTINRSGLIGNFNVALRTHTATFGLSYKFSGLGGPLLVARY